MQALSIRGGRNVFLPAQNLHSECHKCRGWLSRHPRHLGFSYLLREARQSLMKRPIPAWSIVWTFLLGSDWVNCLP